ncbi:carbohydrate sulfotransferase 11-like [Limulus polyphemus]|uniref:Carbohydrate sulfotransferase n=1 Tax=Limulus polyphemus TaxID=6850 RepID=A0ABM1B2V1_LIMPO|nr:carbohydrate sulfotransferase 11-like [Limulus polyphemus]XP_022240644.1 carbohydrate sulfotransferase 11-like [Limulus polyphemus]
MQQPRRKLFLLLLVCVVFVLWKNAAFKKKEISSTSYEKSWLVKFRENLRNQDRQPEIYRRVKRMTEICEKYNMKGKFSSYKEIIRGEFRYVALRISNEPLLKLRSNRDYKMATCVNLKSGSSSALGFLFIVPNNRHKYPHGDVHLRSRTPYICLSFEEYKNGSFPGFLLYMFVRHPFTRLVSFYRDHILYHYKLNNTERTPNLPDVHSELTLPMKYLEGKPITFRDFIQAVLHADFHNPKTFDYHWLPIWMTCAPCHIQYNFIGKVETMSDDLIYLSSLTGLTAELAERPEVMWLHQSGRNNVSSSALTRQFFSSIPKHEIDQLYEKYKLDFELFDYSLNEVL